MSSVLYKFDQRGHLPFALVLMTIMCIWNDVYKSKYYYELDNKVASRMVNELELASNINLSSILRFAIFYLVRFQWKNGSSSEG